MNDTYYGKREMVNKLAEQTGVTKKDCDILVDAMLNILGEMLGECKGINLKGVGKIIFYVRKAATHHDVQTHELITTPPSYYPRFVPVSALRQRFREHEVTEQDMERGKATFDEHAKY